MVRRRAGGAFALGVVSLSTWLGCSAPPERPPPAGAQIDSGPAVHDFGVPDSGPTCQAQGGHCIEPGGPCAIQITGRDPCASLEGGSGQICCVGD